MPPVASLLTERLMRLLEEVSEDPLTIDRDDAGAGSIPRLTIGSVTMMAFLVGIEDEFDLIWDDDVDPEVFDSFERLAAYLHPRVPPAALEGVTP